MNAAYEEIDNNIYLSKETNKLTYFVLNDNINAVITINSTDKLPNKDLKKLAQTIVRNKIPTPTFTPTPTPVYSNDWEIQESDFTPEWKKVVNKKHNYSFEIPKGWILKYGPSIFIFQSQNDIDAPIDHFNPAPHVSVRSEDLSSGRYGRLKEKIVDTQDLYNRSESIFSIAHAGFSSEMTTLGGQEAAWIRVCLELCDESIKVVKDGYVFSVSVAPADGDEERERKAKEILFQVRSNFKFN